MDINFLSRKVTIQDFSIDYKDILDVKKIQFDFQNNSIEFIGISDTKTNWRFLFENSAAYYELKKSIIEKRNDVKIELSKYKNDFGYLHFLWRQLLSDACKSFGVNLFSVGEQYGIHYTSDYWGYDTSKPYNVESNDEAYSMLVSVLPNNIESTIDRYRIEKLNQRIDQIKEICGDNCENWDNYVLYLSKECADDVQKWQHKIESFKEEESLFNSVLDKNQINIIWINRLRDFFNFIFPKAYSKIQTLIKQRLIKNYGLINDNKIALRESLSKLSFKELIDLLHKYNDNVEILSAKKSEMDIEEIDGLYQEYIQLFTYGSVLISKKLNEISRDKNKNKHISTSEYNKAMIYYYETTSVDDARNAQTLDKYAQDKAGGDVGEKKVDYDLKWLDKSFTNIEKKSIDKLGKPCISIVNSEFMDESQEYDHIVVGEKGVFVIETKNYAGKLIIDKNGNWIRKKNTDEEIGEKNPIQQMRRHEKVLKSFLPENVNIVSIICIANDKAVIEGVENCVLPIVKNDMLVEYIESFDTTSKLSKPEIEVCVNKIYEHMVV